jgi:hypothetical protein
MPKKASFPLLTAFFEVLNKIRLQQESLTAKNAVPLFDQPASKPTEFSAPDTALELRRAADALERIANALEKLTAHNSGFLAEINYQEEEYWITLPDTEYNPQVASPKIQTEPDKAGQLADSAAPPQPPLIEKIPLNESNSSVMAAAAAAHDTLYKYLAQHGITVQKPKSPPNQAYQLKLEQLALYLGQNFVSCQDLYKLLKGNMTAPRNSFNYSLKGATAEKNKVVQRFCRLLKEAELIEEPVYQPKPEYNLQLKATGKEQKYLSGSWLEYYVKQEIGRIARFYAERTGQEYEALANLHLHFKDNSKAELDLFFALGKRIFCVEAKLRPGQKDLETYLNRIKPLALDNKAILVVVVDKSEEECQKLSQALGKLRITRLDKLEQTITSLLESAQ